VFWEKEKFSGFPTIKATKVPRVVVCQGVLRRGAWGVGDWMKKHPGR